jgi:hypothetical protein
LEAGVRLVKLGFAGIMMISVWACTPKHVLPTPEPSKPPMGQQEVVKLLSDSTVYIPVPDALRSSIYFSKDGSMRGRKFYQDGDVSSDTGVWSVSEKGVLCMTWENRNDGRTACWIVHEEQDGYGYYSANAEGVLYEIPSVIANEFLYKIPLENYKIGNIDNL